MAEQQHKLGKVSAPQFHRAPVRRCTRKLGKGTANNTLVCFAPAESAGACSPAGQSQASYATMDQAEPLCLFPEPHSFSLHSCRSVLSLKHRYLVLAVEENTPLEAVKKGYDE